MTTEERKRKVMAGIGEETLEVSSADSKERQQFVAQLSKFDKSVTEGLMNGTLQAQDEFIVGTSDEQSGNPISFETFKTNDKVEKGSKSLSEAKVKNDTLLQVVVVGYSQATTGLFEETDIPTELMNGEIEIKIDNGTVLLIPMCAFRMVKNNLNSSSKFLEYPLKNQKVIKKDQVLSVNITLSKGLKTPATNKFHSVRIGVAGIKVAKNTIQ